MFGPRKELKKKNNNITIENNEMYIESIIGRLNTALRVNGKSLYRQLNTAVQQRKRAEDNHRDIKYIYTEGHTANKYGEIHIDPLVLRGRNESLSETEKRFQAADSDVLRVKEEIKELVEMNILNADERSVVEDVESDWNARDKALALKIEKFREEIQSEYEDINQTKKNIHKIRQLDDGLKSFSNHNSVEPRVTNSSIKLLSTAALNKIKIL